MKELENASEKIRSGYALALGALPEFLVSGNLMEILRGLIKAAVIVPKQEAFVEGRRDAVKAITRYVARFTNSCQFSLVFLFCQL